ncbi:hypothetical protein IV203_015840 [Nitzschia inconspicua]|uniref:Uncharacterized protein n=1 Tax=Nitzschia inconspicua TaxID=303405 RepID=A0A9K3LEB9_9STRA|nr:hypothetical protein IV203_015840 [Nitzschia inconspicua]
MGCSIKRASSSVGSSQALWNPTDPIGSIWKVGEQMDVPFFVVQVNDGSNYSPDISFHQDRSFIVASIGQCLYRHVTFNVLDRKCGTTIPCVFVTGQCHMPHGLLVMEIVHSESNIGDIFHDGTRWGTPFCCRWIHLAKVQCGGSFGLANVVVVVVVSTDKGVDIVKKSTPPNVACSKNRATTTRSV